MYVSRLLLVLFHTVKSARGWKLHERGSLFEDFLMTAGLSSSSSNPWLDQFAYRTRCSFETSWEITTFNWSMASFWSTGMPWCFWCPCLIFISVHGICERCLDEDESLNFVQHSSQRIVREFPGQMGPYANASDPADAADALVLPAPFKEALIVSIDPEKYRIAEADLRDQGVLAEMVRGFKAKDPKELNEALDLLTKYGNTAHLHGTVNNWMVCMHTSPGKLPDFSAANSEFWHNLFRSSPKNVSELLERDSHNCVPKIIAIAAAHVRLWERLADGNLPTRRDLGETENPWYLVMEEDVDLCPKWRRRMAEELPLLPADADVVKLYFFGHWRKEDAAPAVNQSGHMTSSPFLIARNPLREFDIIKAATYEVLHGAGWSNVPIAGFYAGTQAYLIRPSGARKLLESIHGKPFQDIDMTMMLSARNYVWRRVLASARPDNVNLLQLETHTQLSSHLGSVPTCNAEPPADQFW